MFESASKGDTFAEDIIRYHNLKKSDITSMDDKEVQYVIIRIFDDQDVKVKEEMALAWLDGEYLPMKKYKDYAKYLVYCCYNKIQPKTSLY